MTLGTHSDRSILEALIEAAVEHAIMVTDLEGTVTFFSHGAERMLGYTAQEMFGKSGLTLADPEELAQLRRACEPISGPLGLRPHAETYRRDWTWVRKDGTRLTVAVVLAHIHDAAAARSVS